MIEASEFVDWLEEAGISMFSGVPDSLLKEFGAHLASVLPNNKHVITANEGGAVSLAIGHYLRTGHPAAVYMQNSGLGNSVNPLLSLADREILGIPMLLIVGWRGQPGTADEPQHLVQGRVQLDLLSALGIPYEILPDQPNSARHLIKTMCAEMTERSTPYVLLVPKDSFSKAIPPPALETTKAHTREAMLKQVIEVVGPGHILVATTGMLSRELAELRSMSDSDGSLDILTVGGMGHASSIALGISMAESQREVWCLDGDGALLMHFGALAIIARHASRRFFHVVFNNGAHDSVGGQPTAIREVDLPGVALACNYRWAQSCDRISEVDSVVSQMRTSGGPALLDLQIRPGFRKNLTRPSKSPADNKTTFMHAVQR